MTALGVVKNGHVRCPRCRYMRRLAETTERDGRRYCSDQTRCERNVRERERLDSWKGAR